MDLASETDLVTQKIEQSRKEIEELKYEYELLIKKGLEGNFDTDVNNDVEEQLQQLTTNRLQGKRQSPKRTARSSISPKTARSTVDTPKKMKYYDVEQTREYMRRQKEKRLEKLREEQKSKENIDEQRKQKLKELHQKSLQILAKSRSKSKEKRWDVNEPIEKLEDTNMDEYQRNEIQQQHLSRQRIKNGYECLNQKTKFIENKQPLKPALAQFQKAKPFQNHAKNANLITPHLMPPARIAIVAPATSESNTQNIELETNDHQMNNFEESESVSTENVSEPKSSSESNATQTKPEINNKYLKAVTTIQAHFRGYKQRQLYKSMLKNHKLRKKPLPEWLQPAPPQYPYNFINTVKRKLHFAVNSPQAKKSEVAIQTPRTSKEIKEVIERSLNEPSKRSDLEDLIQKNVLSIKQLERSFKDLDLKKIESLKLKSKLSDVSDSDTSRNIPDLSSESKQTKSSITEISKFQSDSVHKSDPTFNKINSLVESIANNTGKLSKDRSKSDQILSLFHAEGNDMYSSKPSSTHSNKSNHSKKKIKSLSKQSLYSDNFDMPSRQSPENALINSSQRLKHRSRSKSDDILEEFDQLSKQTSKSIEQLKESLLSSNCQPHTRSKSHEILEELDIINKQTLSPTNINCNSRSRSIEELISSKNQLKPRSDFDFSKHPIFTHSKNDDGNILKELLNKQSTASDYNSKSAKSEISSHVSSQSTRPKSSTHGLKLKSNSIQSECSKNAKSSSHKSNDTLHRLKLIHDRINMLPRGFSIEEPLNDLPISCKIDFSYTNHPKINDDDSLREISELKSINSNVISDKIERRFESTQILPDKKPKVDNNDSLNEISEIQSYEDASNENKAISTESHTKSSHTLEHSHNPRRDSILASNKSTYSSSSSMKSSCTTVTTDKSQSIVEQINTCNENAKTGKHDSGGSVKSFRTLNSKSPQSTSSSSEVKTKHSFKTLQSTAPSSDKYSEKYPSLVKPAVSLHTSADTRPHPKTLNIKAGEKASIDAMTSSTPIHVKFEAELHLLNDFNDSMRQIIAIEKSLIDLKNKNQQVACETRDTQTSFGTVTKSVSESVKNSLTENLNFSRGSEINDDESSISSLNKFMDFQSLGMFEQLIKDEDARINNLKTILKIREKALLDRTKGELAWLEIQKKHLIETGKLHEASLIKKKQRGIVIKLQQEKHEMQKLKQMQKAASEERKSELLEQRNLLRSQAPFQPHKITRIKKATKPTKQGPLRVYQTRHHQHRSITCRTDGTGSKFYTASQTDSFQVSENDWTTDCESIKTDKLTIPFAIHQNSEEAKRTLLMREAVLQKRRKDAEELLQWHQKLVEEESKIAELEMAASNIINQVPSVAIENAAVDDERYSFNGVQLNLLWQNMTGSKEKKYNDREIYKLSQVALERFCTEAKQAGNLSEKLKQTPKDGKDVELEEGIKNSDSKLSEIAQNITHISDELSEFYKISLNRNSERAENSDIETINSIITHTELKSDDISEENTQEIIQSEVSEKSVKVDESGSVPEVVEEEVKSVTDEESKIEELKLPSEEETKCSIPVSATPEVNEEIESHSEPINSICSNNQSESIIASQVPDDISEKIPSTSKSLAQSISLPISTESKRDNNSPDISIVVKSNNQSDEPTNVEIIESIPDLIKSTSNKESKTLVTSSPTPSNKTDESKLTTTINEDLSEDKLSEANEVSYDNDFEVEQPFIDVAIEEKPRTVQLNETITIERSDHDEIDEAISKQTDATMSELQYDEGVVDELDAEEEIHTESSSRMEDEPSEVKRRVSEILANSQVNKSKGDKSPRLQDLYVTTYDVISPTDSPDLSPTHENKMLIQPRDMNNEEQELLRKQIAIEQEIKQLEQQQKQLPYLFVREIPNKPPPPYTPPALHAVPKTTQQIDSIATQLTPVLYEAHQNNQLDDVAMPSSFRIVEMSPSACEFIFDLCKELAMEYYKQFVDDANDVIWLRPSNHHTLSLKKSHHQDELNDLLNRKLREVFAFEKPVGNSRMIIKWSRNKRDQVDEILMAETQIEEEEWTNFEKSELIVKNNLTNFLMNELLSEALNEFQKLSTKC